MLIEELRNQEILKNLISLTNLLQQEINIALENIPLNSLEICILAYISKNEVTQYKIAKEFNTSIQRVNQITTKLEKFGYITKEEAVQNGRIIKKLALNPPAKEMLDVMMNSFLGNLESKGMKIENVLTLNEIVKKLLVDMTDKKVKK